MLTWALTFLVLAIVSRAIQGRPPVGSARLSGPIRRRPIPGRRFSFAIAV